MNSTYAHDRAPPTLADIKWATNEAHRWERDSRTGAELQRDTSLEHPIKTASRFSDTVIPAGAPLPENLSDMIKGTDEGNAKFDLRGVVNAGIDMDFKRSADQYFIAELMRKRDERKVIRPVEDLVKEITAEDFAAAGGEPYHSGAPEGCGPFQQPSVEVYWDGRIAPGFGSDRGKRREDGKLTTGAVATISVRDNLINTSVKVLAAMIDFHDALMRADNDTFERQYGTRSPKQGEVV